MVGATKYEMGTNIRKVAREDLVYPELCYQTLGILFEVWTDVGFGHKEKIYQKAVSNKFASRGISIKEQLPARLVYQNKPIGIYYFDFLVDEKIVLELKVRNYFSIKDIKQVYSYLKAQNLKLGIIAHFTNTGVKYKRVVNIV